MDMSLTATRIAAQPIAVYLSLEEDQDELKQMQCIFVRPSSLISCRLNWHVSGMCAVNNRLAGKIRNVHGSTRKREDGNARNTQGARMGL